MSDGPDNEFRAWRNAILGNIERHENDLEKIKEDISDLKVQIATLRTQVIAIVAIGAFLGSGVADFVARSLWG